jgi:hypothetical protein
VERLHAASAILSLGLAGICTWLYSHLRADVVLVRSAPGCYLNDLCALLVLGRYPHFVGNKVIPLAMPKVWPALCQMVLVIWFLLFPLRRGEIRTEGIAALRALL